MVILLKLDGDYMTMEILLILMSMLLMYVVSAKYFGVIVIMGIINVMVVLIEFDYLITNFDDSLAGGLFWTGVVFYFILMTGFKVAFATGRLHKFGNLEGRKN